MTETVFTPPETDFWGRVRRTLAIMGPQRDGAAGQSALGGKTLARQLGLVAQVSPQADELLRLAWSHCAERHATLCVLIIEIDRFAEYHAAYGRNQSEQCLASVQGLIDQLLPRDDLQVLRHERAGFVVVLPNYPMLMARALAQKIDASIHGAALAHKESHVGQVGVCIGLTAINPEGLFDKKFFEHAATTLSTAQRRGLGRIEAMDLRGASAERKRAS